MLDSRDGGRFRGKKSFLYLKKNTVNTDRELGDKFYRAGFATERSIWQICFAVPEPNCVATKMGYSDWLSWFPHSFLWPNEHVTVIGSPSSLIWDKWSPSKIVNVVHHLRKEERELGRQKQMSSMLPCKAKMPPAKGCLLSQNALLTDSARPIWMTLTCPIFMHVWLRGLFVTLIQLDFPPNSLLPGLMLWLHCYWPSMILSHNVPLN